MKKQGTSLPPPWMAGSKDIHGVPMLVVHMQDGELEGLDNLQGGASIDPDTGIREYSALAEIIDLPQIRELFHKVASELEEKGKVSPGVHQAYEVANDNTLPYRQTREEEHGPINSLEKTGRGGDKHFALIPVNLAEFLIEMRHVPSINPKTGLLEFGFFRSVFKNLIPNVLRTAGTIGGFMLGGPLGAGVGNAVGRAVTGSSIKNSLVGGLKTGALGYGVQSLGGMAKGLGGLGGLGVGAAGNASAAPGVVTAAGAAAAPGAAAPASGLFSNVGGLLSNLAVPGAMMGLAYKGSKDQYKHEKEHRDRLEARYDKERAEQGWSTDWTPVTSKRQEINPDFYNVSEDDIRHGRTGNYAFRDAPGYARGGLVQSYSKGTLVKGKGKGQDDLIKTSVPDGTYIIDASSTSDFGDGSSSAGAAVLSKFENHVKKKFPSKIRSIVHKEISKTSQQVPVWLSNDEYKFDPVTVTLLGNGSNKRGADALRRMVKNLRKHKISNGNELPPKAKNPLDYIGRRI